MLRRAVLPFDAKRCHYAFVMADGVRNGPSHRQPVSRVAGKHPAARSSGNVAPAAQDRVIGRSSRFAGVPANVEPDRPMVGMQEIGARSGRGTAAGNWTDEETAIAD